jgi:hypothetical protein
MTDSTPKRRKSRTFQLDGFAVTLTRLTDRSFDALWDRSIAIAEDGLFIMHLARQASAEGEDLNFAEIHFVLQRLYSRSGRTFDDWKGSFSFPFSLEIIRHDRSLPYTLEVRNRRTSLEFAIRRIVSDPAEADHAIHQPIPAEFSREEINYFIAYFYGYLGGYLEALLERKPRICPFIRRIESNLILYGYRDGAFFEDYYDDPDAFNADYVAFPAPATGKHT